MGKIKIGLIIFTSLALIGVVVGGIISAQDNPFQGKIIALDAGHGGTANGAVNQTSNGVVAEKDVNLSVVYTLKQKLEDADVGAKVVLTRKCDETISSRKSRVDMAIEECKALYGRKCDALVSVHHNGSTDANHDGTMVIYNENQDKPLATALHDSLILGLGLVDEGYDNGGYGMTVFGHLVSVLTEAYYITNTAEANHYISGILMPISSYDASSTCSHPVRFGDRVNQEADALYRGLNKYFSIPLKMPGRK